MQAPLACAPFYLRVLSALKWRHQWLKLTWRLQVTLLVRRWHLPAASGGASLHKLPTRLEPLSDSQCN